METLKYYFYYNDSRFMEFPLVIRITLTLTFVLLLMYVISLTRIIISGISYKRKRRRDERVIKKYDQIVQDIVFSPVNMTLDEVQEKLSFKLDKKKAWKQEHISTLLFTITKGMEEAGLNNHNYLHVLTSFSLPEFW